MTLETWLLFSGAALVVILIPGPLSLLMISNSLNYGLRRSYPAFLGGVFASICLLSASALGLGALLLASEQLFSALKIVGTMYSGTVAAALEGRFLGRTAFAFSLASRQVDNLASAAYFARRLVEAHGSLVLPPRTVLNVNIPNLPLDHIRGIQLTRLGHRSRAAAPLKVVDPRGREGYWIAAAGDAEDGGPGTDFHAVMQGYVSITPLQLDRTFNDAFGGLEPWLEGLR